MRNLATEFNIRPHRLTARTPGSHPGNRSSILRGVTFTNTQVHISLLYFFGAHTGFNKNKEKNATKSGF